MALVKRCPHCKKCRWLRTDRLYTHIDSEHPRPRWKIPPAVTNIRSQNEINRNNLDPAVGAPIYDPPPDVLKPPRYPELEPHRLREYVNKQKDE